MYKFLHKYTVLKLYLSLALLSLLDDSIAAAEPLKPLNDKIKNDNCVRYFILNIRSQMRAPRARAQLFFIYLRIDFSTV